MTALMDSALDIESWIDASWDPDEAVGDWWSRLAAERLAHPMLPEPWGRGWSRDQAAKLVSAIEERGAIGPPIGMGLVLVTPTLLAHASEALKARLIPGLLAGTDGWCQLFSEPGAGSDLAGLQSTAVRDGDEWVVTGQKVWTTLGQWADYGILLARTDAGVPKHKGITCFAIPMGQPGVTVRPLREMTGREMFNEVFLDEARVPHDHVIGDVGDGWRVANTTLMVERSGIGSGNLLAHCAAIAGSLAGHLERPAGSFVGEPPIGEIRIDAELLASLAALARTHGRAGDASIRQSFAELHTLLEVSHWHVARAKAGGAATGVEGNLAKLRNSSLVRVARDLGCAILGPGAMLVGPESPSGGAVQELTVFSPAPSIYGGADQVQRNIVGERGLGLPREPGPAKDTPYRDLPKNTTPRR